MHLSYKEGIAFNMKPTAIHISNKEHHKWEDNASEMGPAGAVVDTIISNGFSFLSISPKNVILEYAQTPTRF